MLASVTATTPREGRVSANGIEFAYLELGSGPLALCVHGFPDSAWTWRHLLPELAEAGYRAVAPFQRGYAPTDLAPDGQYGLGAIGSDVAALSEALGGEGDAVLIGHDWGAPAVYSAANLRPDSFRRVVGMAVPPAMGPERILYYDQLKRSFYIFFFQLPIAEPVVSADDLAFIDGLWRDWTAGGDHAESVARAKDCLRDPDHLTAALGYYRALFDPEVPAELQEAQAAAAQAPPQPTLYLHGRDDGALGVELAEDSRERLAPGSRMEIVDGANHFLHLERPEEINRLVVEWVTG